MQTQIVSSNESIEPNNLQKSSLRLLARTTSANQVISGPQTASKMVYPLKCHSLKAEFSSKL